MEKVHTGVFKEGDRGSTAIGPVLLIPEGAPHVRIK